jgi:hypothetical protein
MYVVQAYIMNEKIRNNQNCSPEEGQQHCSSSLIMDMSFLGSIKNVIGIGIGMIGNCTSNSLQIWKFKH